MLEACATGPSAKAKQPHTVLVVDDDAAVRSALKFVLEIEGFRVRLYADAQALLDEDDLPTQGCLVIDYRMPGMNGLELVEKLRADDVQLPVVLICSRLSGWLRSRALQAGIGWVLEKPLSDSTLIECIRRTT
jgi:FixJ family two-component response regulator